MLGRAAAALKTGVIWSVLGALVVIFLALSLPRVIGGQSYAVLSNSMAGSVETGDLVIALPRRAEDIAVGEIVVFADPEGSGKRFQHRVQRVSRLGDRIEVVTMGDANTGYERWRVADHATVGRVAFVIAKAGYLFGPISIRAVARPLAGLAWLALLGMCLQTIWRRPGRQRAGWRLL